MSARKERKHTAYHKFGQLLEVLDKRHPLFPNGSDHCRYHRGTLGANVLGNKWGTDVLGTPIYNKTILGTKRHPAGIFFFGHFLVRLSESDHSRV